MLRKKHERGASSKGLGAAHSPVTMVGRNTAILPWAVDEAAAGASETVSSQTVPVLAARLKPRKAVVDWLGVTASVNCCQDVVKEKFWLANTVYGLFWPCTTAWIERLPEALAQKVTSYCWPATRFNPVCLNWA